MPALYATVFLCSFGVVISTQGHRFYTGLETSSALGNLTVNHQSRFPLYMMQLYRSFRTADSSPAVGDAAQGDNLSSHSSDSVLSLMAKGE